MKFLALPLVLLIFLGLISTLYVSASVNAATERVFKYSCGEHLGCGNNVV